VMAGTKASSRTIEYQGNDTVGDKVLNSVVADDGLEVTGWLEPGKIAEALESFYRSQGYLQAVVTAGEPELRGSAAVLPVVIDEGKRYTLEAINFPGVDAARQADVAAAAALEIGTPFVTSDLDKARRRIQDLYAERGFNAATVEVVPAPDETEGVVDVTFTIDEGSQQVLREVKTQGATQTRDGVIARALRLQIGEPVKLADWSQARKRMYDTNVFRQVDLEPELMTQTPEDLAAHVQPVRALVKVIEYPVWRLRYGLQFNDERTSTEGSPTEERQQNLGVLTDLRNQNLFGRAITAGIAGRFERDRRSESLFMSNASFFGLPLRTSGFVFVSHQRFRIGNEVISIFDRRGISAEQRWRPFRSAEVTYGYRMERNRIFDPTPSASDPIPLDIPSNISKLNASMYVDRRDDPFEPTTGWFSSINWDQSITALGSDSRSSRLLVQQLYFRHAGRVVLASRMQVGTSFSRESLLLTERFFLGGATTVRGYGENTLGPLDGGDATLLFNGEARFPVRGWVQGVVFVDAGNVFLKGADPDTGAPIGGGLTFSDLKVGYGIGLRLASPFAMLRVDFGIPTSAVSPDQPKSRGRFYIGIGHIF